MEDYRGKESKKDIKKAKWLIKTNCAIHSIKEVECFLHNLKKASRYIHFYKFLK